MLKLVRRGSLIIVVIITLFAAFSYFRHQNLLNEERLGLNPPGKMVEVNGHEMHVYTEGQGDITLVFMSGGGTSAPLYDFKSLFSRLSNEYQIALVEKAGYGFSEVSGEVSRDIDAILSETREALMLGDVEGPFVLVPHSMSGLEAVYWAQKYPAEVEMIIGLDMALPEVYEDYSINMPLVRSTSLLARLGLTRWLPQLAESEAMKYGDLTEEGMEQSRLLFYQRTATADMMNEVEKVKENADRIGSAALPEIPILLFVSNGEGTGYDADKWREVSREFAENYEQVQYAEVDAPHYIHNHEYESIAELIKAYLDE